jgi:hypothetical protein
MSAELDLDDVAYGHPKAMAELAELRARQDRAPQGEAIGKYAVDKVRADESVALAEKIMDRVISSGSAYLRLELVDPTTPSASIDAAQPAQGEGWVQDVKRLLAEAQSIASNNRWGTYPYMEGTEIYDDLRRLNESLDAIAAMLAATPNAQEE